MEYAFELPNGRWFHQPVELFRDEAHARDWAERACVTFKGICPAPRYENEPGSASWCETNGDNS